MGTTVWVVARSRQVEWARVRAQHVFETWESRLSRFRPQSELSRLNGAGGRPVRVSRELFEVVFQAVRAAQATQGRFDPTLGRHLAQLGYDRSWEIVPPEQAGPVPLIDRPSHNWQAVEMAWDTGTIRLPRGVWLDLGGIGKGMAVAAAVTDLKAAGVDPVMVNAGGDLAVSGHPPGGGPWPIGIGNEPYAAINLDAGGLATSGLARRQWVRGGVRCHHLIDPATGVSVNNSLFRVTVAAPTAMQADVAAKVALISGPEAGKRFLLEVGLSGEMEWKDGTLDVVGRWPEERQTGGFA